MTTTSHRLAGIDLLRGLVMVVMLLDHTRDFVHVDGFTGDPTDLRTTTPALFLTRWVTHFCAPVFVFLAGLAVRLQLLRGRDSGDVARTLLRRGLLLVALELVVLRPLIWFQLDPAMLAFLQVIWVIGWSMCALAVLLRWRVPAWAIGGAGLAVVAGHNLLVHVPFSFARAGSAESLRILLVGRGGVQFGADGPVAVVAYALVPWLGILLCGFACGRLYASTPARRQRALVGLGLAAIALFALLRGLGQYGDPGPWSPALDGWRRAASFLRVEKYPPSLHYLLVTIGPALLFLGLAEAVRSDGRWRVLVTLGRAPLFFYVLQWPTVHLTARLFQWLDGQPTGWDAPDLRTLATATALPPGCGFSLPIVYLAWALCLLVLVPMSLWFVSWQARHPGQRWHRLL